jgi:UPF0716 protein FxsA
VVPVVHVGHELWHHGAMGRLLLLFIALPAAELALLIEFGSRFGTLHTLMLIVLTGIVGATLARNQGLGVMREIQEEVAAGRLPAGSLVDGVILLVAAALLMTPGILTDAFGFLCLVPALRTIAKRILWSRLEAAVRENRVDVNLHFDPPERTVHDVRDVKGKTLRKPPDV